MTPPGRLSRHAVILGIIAFAIVFTLVIVPLLVAYGLRIDYLLREQTTLSIAASDAIKAIASNRLAGPCSYDLRNRLIGPTMLEFRIRGQGRAHEDEIRAIIHDEIGQLRKYLKPIELVIIFED